MNIGISPGMNVEPEDTTIAGLLETLDDHAIVAITDKRGVITHANARFCELSKYREAELLGKTHRVINSGFHPKTFWVSMWNTISQGKVWSGEVCNRAKDGSLYWLYTTIRPLKNKQGEVVSHISIRTDITAVKEANLRLDLATEAGGIGIWEWNMRSDSVKWTPRMYQMHGVREGEVDDLRGFWLGCIHPDDLERFTRNMYGSSGDERKISLDYRMLTQEGMVRNIGLRGVVERTKHGKVERIVGTAIDRTGELKQREDLSKALADATQASEAKSRFLANMSHELRTPLNGVIGLASLLHNELNLTETQVSTLERIEESGQSLLALINDILDYANLESGKTETTKVDFDLKKALVDLGMAFEGRAREKGLEFSVKISPNVPQIVHGAVDHLRQVLTILIQNAIKFTSRGKVLVSATKSGRIGDGYVIKFEVTDTGIGISDTVSPLVFDGFAQGDSRSTRAYGGTGLGLAICKRLLELMDGVISFQSKEGQGTTFTCSVALEGPKWERHLGLPKTLTDRSALVVSKDTALRSRVEEILGLWQLNCGSCARSSVALELLSRKMEAGSLVDYVVLDARNEGMSAKAFLSHLEEIFPERLPRVILVDAISQDFSSLAELEFITLPLRQSDLFDCLVSGEGSSGYAKEATEKVKSTVFDGRSKRVLVAEDKPSNQKVIASILQRFGIQAKCVENGLEVIEALRSETFDLIFMDIQMPQLDGIETTKLIREALDARWDKQLPVVALTANSDFLDRAACFEAGMDDFAVKPVNSDEILRILRRLLPPLSKEKGSDQLEALQPDADAFFDASSLLASFDNDREAVRDILSNAIPIIRDVAARFQRQIAAGDLQGARASIHRLTGAVGNLRCHKFYRLCGELDFLLESGDLGEVLQRLDSMEEKSAATIEQLERFCR